MNNFSLKEEVKIKSSFPKVLPCVKMNIQLQNHGKWNFVNIVKYISVCM